VSAFPETRFSTESAGLRPLPAIDAPTNAKLALIDPLRPVATVCYRGGCEIAGRDAVMLGSINDMEYPGMGDFL